MEDKDKNDMDITIGYQTLQERVYYILRNDILSGKLSPNASLNTNELSRKMNVSRTPIRDAVNKLESIGLAVKVNHKEARVADFMSDEMYEIFCARAALEGIAASSTAKYMSLEKKRQLVEMSKTFQKLAEIGDDNAFMELDQEFHFMIYKCMKTQLLRDMVEQLYIISKRNRDAGYHVEGRGQQVVTEHIELAKAIYEGDEKRAEILGTQHHANTIFNLKKKFEQLKRENQKIKNIYRGEII